MNKVLIFLLMSVFMISMVSALEFDNFKYQRDITFDGKQVAGNSLLEKYNPIEIVNAFGLGATLFEGYISQHTETCGIDCSSTIEIKLHNDGILINDIIFKTLQEDESWVEQNIRSYQFSYQGEIQDYKTICIQNKELSENGTITETCSRVKNGTHVGDINYPIGEEVKAGSYTLKLEANKKPSRTVDWIVKTNGEWLESWATWGNISQGDNAEVTLNYPLNETILYSNPLNFNATANITGGASLTNMSLWTNKTGSWTLHNKTLTNPKIMEITNEEAFSTIGGQTNKQGMKMLTKDNLTLTTITKDTDTTATIAYVTNSTFGVLDSANFVGNNATFSYSLINDTLYYIVLNSGGGEFTLSYDTTFANPTPRELIDWVTAWNGDAETSDRVYGIRSITVNQNKTSKIQNWENTITEGIIWNVQSCDSDGDCGFATENRTLLMDTTAPTITIESPPGTLDSGVIGKSETLNVTFTDNNLESCWYDYNGTNITIDGCLTGIKNSTTFILEYNNYNMTIWANDSLGNTNSEFIEWNYSLFLNSINYSAQTRTGAVEDFTINITYSEDFTGISMLLNYNETNYTMSSTGSTNTLVYNKEIIIPRISTETNLTFYFIALLSNGTQTTLIETTKLNQTVSPFLIDNCSTYTKTLLIFEMLDEDSQDEINGTIEFTIDIYSHETTNLISSYNNSYTYIIGSDSKVCLDNITEDYTMSYQIRHYGNEDYFKKYKNIQRMTINNEILAQNITLYNLNESRGYPFNIIVVGNLLYSVGNVGLLVDIQRQYLSENVFKSIESSITNSEGIAVGHLIENEEIYNFIISYNEEVLGTFNNYQVKCANAPLGQCSITLNLAQATGTSPDFENYGDITQLFTLDTSTNTLHHTFSSTDGEVKEVRSLILKDDGYGNTTICDNSASGTSGTLTCVIPAQYNNASFFVQTFVDEEYTGSKYFSQGATIDWQGADILILLLMFSSLVLLFVGHPITIIIGALFGLVAPVLLISLAGATFGSLVSATLFYIAGGIIAVIVMSRRRF